MLASEYNSRYYVKAKNFPKEETPKTAHFIVFLGSQAGMTYFV